MTTIITTITNNNTTLQQRQAKQQQQQQQQQQRQSMKYCRAFNVNASSYAILNYLYSPLFSPNQEAAPLAQNRCPMIPLAWRWERVWQGVELRAVARPEYCHDSHCHHRSSRTLEFGPCMGKKVWILRCANQPSSAFFGGNLCVCKTSCCLALTTRAHTAKHEVPPLCYFRSNYSGSPKCGPLEIRTSYF